jgi:hypothetical protein
MGVIDLLDFNGLKADTHMTMSCARIELAVENAMPKLLPATVKMV